MTIIVDCWKREKSSMWVNFIRYFDSFPFFLCRKKRIMPMSDSIILYKDSLAKQINNISNKIDTLQIQAEIIEISQNNNIPLSSNQSNYNNIFFINNFIHYLNNDLIILLNHQLNMESDFTNTTHDPDSIISVF